MKAIFEVKSFFVLTIRNTIYLEGIIKEGETQNGMFIKNLDEKEVEIKGVEIATSGHSSTICLGIEKTDKLLALFSKLNFPILLEIE